MKLELVHDFSTTVDRWFDIVESDALQERIAERSTSRRERLSESREGGVLARSWRITPSRELPGVITKLLGNQALSYVQSSVVDRERRRVDWRIEVARAAGRADIGGVLTLEPTPTGCRRTMTAQIAIRVPLVGRKVEEAIARDVRRTYERSHRLIEGIAAEDP